MLSISPVYARIVLREYLRAGLDPAALLAGTALDVHTLQSGGDLTLDDFILLLANADRLMPDQPIGLLIGRHTNITLLGQVGAVVAIAPSVRDGLRAMASFSRLHAGYIEVELRALPEGLRVGLRYLDELGATGRFHTESAIMLIQDYVETLTGNTLDAAHYSVDYARPDYFERYADCIHGSVSFDSGAPAVLLPPSALDEPSPYYNAEMWLQGQMLLAARLREYGRRGEQTYTRYLQGLLRSTTPPLPDLAAVAAQLHLSERTLNRRLQAEGSSYRALRMEVVDEWARRYLRETGDSVEAISAALGYRDAANFRRAFRKRFGCSPGEYRRQQDVHSASNTPTSLPS